jgi:5-methylcytosine-specific restriction endonuclease McrA
MVKVKKGHRYKILEVLSFSEGLKRIKNSKSHRLQSLSYLIKNKGTKCVNENCDNEGSKFMIGLDRGGGVHIDLYTHDNILMTIDHIIPKSKEGPNHVNNYQLMCCTCNSNKGNKI